MATEKGRQSWQLWKCMKQICCWQICWIHFMLQRVYNNNLRKRMVNIKSISKGHAIYINGKLDTVYWNDKYPDEDAWVPFIQKFPLRPFLKLKRGRSRCRVLGCDADNMVILSRGRYQVDGGDWCQELSVSVGWMLFWSVWRLLESFWDYLQSSTFSLWPWKE